MEREYAEIKDVKIDKNKRSKGPSSALMDEVNVQRNGLDA